MTNYRPRYSSSSRSNTFKPRSVRRAEKKTKKHLIITILVVIVLGYFLLSWGIPVLIGSLSVFNKLKPEDKVVANISDGAIAPPILNIPFEATNSANLIINGYASSGSEVEIYLNDELKSTTTASSDGSFSISDITLSKGQNNIYGKTVNGEKTSLPSKTIRIVFNDDKPRLDISEPADGHEVKGGDKKVNVVGATDPDNLISVNGQTTIVNSDGTFSLTVSLNDGDNTINILATTPIGNISKTERRVTYTP